MSVSSTLARRTMPALFTTASMRPRADKARLTWSSSLMSQMRLPAKGAAIRSIAVICAPSAAAACAIARPSPEAAPVTTTCFSEKRMPRHSQMTGHTQRLVRPAGHDDALAGNPGRVVAGEENRDPGNVIGLADTAERRGSHHLLFQIAADDAGGMGAFGLHP